jgi:hypothetical protein
MRASGDRLPDPQRSLNELGVDSLMGVELCNALGRGAGKHLAPTILFAHPTLAGLADYLAADVLGLAEAKEQPEDRTADELREKALAEVEQMTEEELNAILSASSATDHNEDPQRQNSSPARTLLSP